jgi:hypothetical protein
MATAATSPVFDYASAIKSGYDLWNQNVNAGAAKATAADSAKNWTDQMNGAGTSQSSLSQCNTSKQWRTSIVLDILCLPQCGE